MGLLDPKDPPPFNVFNENGTASILFTSDHNGSSIPKKLKNLGVADHEMRRHVAYDIGIDAVSHALATRFNAPLIVSNYSRLVIDCNRHPGAVGSIPMISDRTIVPGNKNLSSSGVQNREKEIFTAYHSSVSQQIEMMQRNGKGPTLIALHSFTPVMDRAFRPWEIGILWKDDERLARPIIEKLRQNKILNIGDNKPYSGSEPAGYTVDFHVAPLNLMSIAVEFRQDLIEFQSGAEYWANYFGDALDSILNEDII